jgi:hypothetical protein
MFKPNDLHASRLAWRLGSALLTVLAVCAGAAAWSAGDDVQGRLMTVKARIDEGRTRPAQVRDAFRLRCWQHGRLLFEESIAEVPQGFAGQSMAIPSGESVHGTVYLLNTQGSLCLMKPSDAPARGNPTPANS